MCVGDGVERKKEDPCPAPTPRLLLWGKLKEDPGKEPRGLWGGEGRAAKAGEVAGGPGKGA